MKPFVFTVLFLMLIATPSQAAQGVDVTKKIPYYSVPEQQVKSLELRMKIVQLIVEKHGRAYDYRHLTLTQLQEIEKELDRQKKSSSVSVP